LRAYGGHEAAIYDMRLDYRRIDRVEQAIRLARPDAIGLSAQSPEAPVLHRLALLCKGQYPRVPVVAGGIHVTNYPDDTLANDPHIDCVIPGEGEFAFHELVEALQNGRDPQAVAGVVYRENGEARRAPLRPVAPDPDVVPYPAWDLIDLNAYGRLPRIGLIYAHRRYMIVETARACPFNCAWCHKTAGDVHRMHRPEYVIGEIETLVKKHGVGEITIVDDMFNFRTERVNAIFEGLIQRGIRVPISVVNGLRADLLPDATLELMRRAGVYRVMFAIETASPRLQKLMRKNLDFAKVRRAIDKAYDLGMLIHGNFIIGLPGETEDEVNETVRFAASSKMDTIGLYRAIPYKGCDLYRIAQEQGLAVPPGEATFSFWDSDVNLSRVPVQALNRAKKRAYWLTYLRPRRVWRLLRLIPNKNRLLPFLFMFFIRKALKDN
jgi:radical SAM superfamily enzyme YgiQ (UPF0313 family)